MHEALIQNWIRLIPWGDFWEPYTTKQRCVKWGIITLVLLLGISIFLINLDDLQTYEYACGNPIVVEAERNVVVNQSWFTGGTYYEIYVSYSYNGVSYEDVLYRTTQNPNVQWDGIESITVAVAPNDPGVLIRNMFNATPIFLGVMLWSLGLSLLIYGIAIEFSAFREWRIKQANRPGLLSRPYGKPIEYSENPDYLKDVAIIFISIVSIGLTILALIFPYTF